MTVQENVLAILREHQQRQDGERGQLKEDWGLVLTARDGSPVDASDFLDDVWYPPLKVLGLPNVFHQLRHTSVSYLLGGEDPILLAAVAKHGGWSDTPFGITPMPSQRTTDVVQTRRQGYCPTRWPWARSWRRSEATAWFAQMFARPRVLNRAKPCPGWCRRRESNPQPAD